MAQRSQTITRLIRILAGAGSVLLAILISALAWPDFRSALVGSDRPASVGTAQIGGPFRLVTHDGRTVTDADFHGKALIVQFGQVGCGVTCRAGLQLVGEVLRQLPSDRTRIAPVFITLAPEIDTPAALRRFLQRDHPGILGLTGDASAIADVARAYVVNPARIADPDAPGGVRIEHQSLIYVMDRDGRYAAHFSFASPVAEIVEAVRRLK